MKYKTLVESLKENIKLEGIGINIIKTEDIEKKITYQQLYNRALKMLGGLQAQGIKAGDELVFQIDSIEDFINVFWACILGKIIPVPVAVGNNYESNSRMFKIFFTLNNPYVLTSNKNSFRLKSFAEKEHLIEEFQKINEKTILIERFNENSIFGKEEIVNSNDIAFIQFSSGSTEEPKGIMLTHENIMTNIKAIIKNSQITREDSFFSWMPLFHDMGLIGFHLVPSVVGINQNIMPTKLFIRKPMVWLNKINEYRNTITSSPNFGCKYFISNFDEKDAREWDLSCIRLIFNGAEPISSEIASEFTSLLKDYKLKEECMYPVYGMAEATLAITFPPVLEKIKSVNIKRNSLIIGKKIEVIDIKEDDSCINFVDVGYAVDNCKLRIVGDKGQELGENYIGHIEIIGKNVTRGYYNNSKRTKELIKEDGWLSTGDLGFLRNSRLIITGRHKDIIIVNGINYYPQDIEAIVERMDEVTNKGVVACGVYNENLNNDDIVLFIKLNKTISEVAELALKIKERVNSCTGIEVKSIIPVRLIPKTTSGKVQRFKLAQRYINCEFKEIEEEINWILKSIKKNDRNIEEKNMDPNSIQVKLLNIAREILRKDDLNISDNFIEAGANSIIITRFQQILEANFNIKVSVAQIFANPTIISLSKYIENQEEIIEEERHISNIDESMESYFDDLENKIKCIDYEKTAVLADDIRGGLI
ncbi:non-ribosomal peptide synthetase [Clostridium sp. LP20]|uniref:non-ribosomal peptide synthetase n=1 Tax=Clostridium sp. LP20 TaxID=3418665 RepID=UPI003EE7C9BF